MAQDIAELGLRVRSDGVVVAEKRLRDMSRSAGRAEGAAERLSKTMRKMGRNMALAAAAAGAGMAALAARSVKLGIEAEETAAKFQVVFRGSVRETDEALIALTRTIPLTISEMRGLSAGIQDMIVPMGVARDEAANLSVQAVSLAGDLAAFNNTSPERVLQDIKSALAGSAEPMLKYGVDTRVAALEQIALKEGLIETGEALDSTARAQAVFSAIINDSADAIGTAERELDSAAGMMRTLSRDVRQAQEDLGLALLPTFTELLRTLNEVGSGGLTPVQAGMRALAGVILELARITLRAVEGFTMIGNAAENFGDRLIARFSRPDILKALATITALRGGPASGGVATVANAAAGQAADVAAAAEARIEARTAAMNEGLETVRASISALDDALIDLDNGFDRTLGEGADAADDMGDAASGAADKVREAISEIQALGSRRTVDADAYYAALVRGIDAEIEALNGGTEAWEEYTRQQDIARVTASMTNDLMEQGVKITDDMTAAIAAQAEELVDARSAFRDLGDDARTFADSLGESADIMRDVFSDLRGNLDAESDAYKKLTVAIQAANVVKGVAAVLKQLSEGDVYSALPRAAAVAAAVSSLGVAIGNLSSGFGNIAAERQDAQGTGTVMGDAEAKSESIAKATEITAKATSELVGINRGMLRALQNLSDSITGASGIVRQQVQGLEFGGGPDVSAFGDFLDIFDPLGILSGLLGGKSRVVDEGIRIMAGTLDELITGGLVQAFQSVEAKKNIFDDYDLYEEFLDLPDEAQQQFGLVFAALRDTILSAGEVLGLDVESLREALSNARIDEQIVSLFDLSGDEQRAEIEAVFGAIFDDLVSQVIPFIEQFQQAGEGLGETLVRVATSVQVFDAAIAELGLAFDETDPERVAQIAVGLVDMAGGVEEFIGLFTGFLDRFASEEQKLEFLTGQLEGAFEGINLELPLTRDAFLDLFQSLDVTTEAGQRAIVTLLEIAPLADEYYSILEENERQRLNAIRQQRAAIEGFIGLGPSQQLMTLRDGFVEAMEAAKALNATNREYALIIRSFERQLQRFTAELTISVIRQSQALFGEAANVAGDAFESGTERVRLVANSLFDEWQRALTNIKGFADSVLLDTNLTTLSPAQRLAEARRQFNDILTRARGGDVEAAGDLPGAAEAFLNEARFMFASGGQYQQIFRDVQEALRGVEMPPGIEEFTKEIVKNTARTVSAVEEFQNETVQRLERLLQAMDLSNTLRDLGFALDQSPVQIADELGVPLDELAAALGVDLNDVSRETVMGIINMAELLGADIFALGDALGVDIQALADRFEVALDVYDFDSVFMTQNDWLSSIDATLTRIEAWLGVVNSDFIGDGEDMRLGGPGGIVDVGDTPTVTFGSTGGNTQPPTGSTGGASGGAAFGGGSSGGGDDKGVRQIVETLNEMRDENERYYEKATENARQIEQLQQEQNALMRRTAA